MRGIFESFVHPANKRIPPATWNSAGDGEAATLKPKTTRENVAPTPTPAKVQAKKKTPTKRKSSPSRRIAPLNLPLRLPPSLPLRRPFEPPLHSRTRRASSKGFLKSMLRMSALKMTWRILFHEAQGSPLMVLGTVLSPPVSTSSLEGLLFFWLFKSFECIGWMFLYFKLFCAESPIPYIFKLLI